MKYKNAMRQLADHNTTPGDVHLLGKVFGEPVHKKRWRHTECNIGDRFQADLSVTESPSEERGDIKLVVEKSSSGVFILVQHTD